MAERYADTYAREVERVLSPPLQALNFDDLWCLIVDGVPIDNISKLARARLAFLEQGLTFIVKQGGVSLDYEHAIWLMLDVIEAGAMRWPI